MKILVTTAALLLLASASHAAQIAAVESTSSSRAAIFLEGEVTEGDTQRFSNAVSVLQKHPHWKEADLVLNSPGGLLDEGLAIGAAIADLKTITLRTIVQTTCESACALIWLAGQPRGAYVGAHIGFHAAYTCNKPCTSPKASLSGKALVGAYLRKLDFGAPAISYFTQTRPENMEWLTSEKAREFGLSLMMFDRNGKIIN